jgi:hypothetical protein
MKESELESRLDEKISSLNELQKTTFSAVKEVTLGLVKGVSPDDDQLKSLTTRLPLREYARLKVLSTRLNQSSVSALARTLLIASLQDSIDVCCVDEVEFSEFLQEVFDVELELSAELAQS